MTDDVKQREMSVYDEDDERPEYGSLWDESHHATLLAAGPEGRFERLLADCSDDDRVLVLGCGGGRQMTRLLAGEDDPTVVGIELSERQLRAAVDRVGRADGVADFARADAETLPFAGDAFDVVVAHSVLHHLPNWRTDGLRELRRVLDGEGRLLLYEPGAYNPPAAARRQLVPSDSHTPDEHPFDPAELEATLREQFDQVDLEGHCLVSNVLPVVDGSSPLPVPSPATTALYRLERTLMQSVPGTRRLAWILTGVCTGPDG